MEPEAVKFKFRALRKQGLTYAEINSKLDIAVSKSTAAGWCSDIRLADNQRSRINKLNIQKLAINRLKALEVIRKKRAAYLQGISNKYANLSDKLSSDRQTALIALSILNLTEGGKQPSSLMFGNSDPKIIKLFLKLLRKCYPIDETKFRCTLQCRADQNIKELEKFWSEITGIPLEKFYDAQIDARSHGRVTLKLTYKGVCRIDYFSANIYNELQIISQIIGS
ncbi:MAG TPA: hypothetical protein VLE93_01725 [Candidatus Saccharimonadales bacterium]|nr:hypothetical protein [Candidatus Saccharimonadales bacterium]